MKFKDACSLKKSYDEPRWHIKKQRYYFPSVQFSRSVVSDSLWSHESQQTRPPCPSPTPRVHSDSCPLSPWCHPAISSSVVPFSSCPQSLPASKSFLMSQLFAWVAKALEFQLQHHSFQRNPRADLLQNGLVRSPCSSRDSQESSPIPQFICEIDHLSRFNVWDRELRASVLGWP